MILALTVAPRIASVGMKQEKDIAMVVVEVNG